jgi:D-lyxose ketol-isomerase
VPMKRSEVNELLRRSIEFCRRMNFHLPPFAFWSPEDWARAGREYDEIRDNQLGWDITDFGQGRFAELGLVVFTIRNGNPNPASGYEKPYCEKLLVVEESQRTPCHHHATKVEDIICRAGGDLLIQVHNRSDDGRLADTPVCVNVDGRAYEVEAGAIIRLTPGESITLPSYQYHEFWAAPGTGTSLVGEVSTVNDDHHDNFFLGEVGRFPDIEEDEPPLHLLCTEYPPVPRTIGPETLRPSRG